MITPSKPIHATKALNKAQAAVEEGRPDDALAWVPHLSKKGALHVASLARSYDAPAVLRASLARLVPYTAMDECFAWSEIMLGSCSTGQLGCVEALLAHPVPEDSRHGPRAERLAMAVIVAAVRGHTDIAKRLQPEVSWDAIEQRVLMLNSWQHADRIAQMLSPPQSWKDAILARAPAAEVPYLTAQAQSRKDLDALRTDVPAATTPPAVPRPRL